ncbi:hypothetical protein R6Q59_031532 [Mikania micrantha]|uniref:BHLH domain-containing protein n=1 Tax=Mikania micrantha TaxID=192012 RepID=A0A5N6NVV8_9ASTR|nr:hypothetical protein E3N88_15382 [Mikania micrantha]
MADSWWDSRTRPCLGSVSVTSMNLFQETTESTATTTTTTSGGDHGGGEVLANNPSLQMMELGLSSQPISQSLDWNQALYRGDQRNDGHQSGYPTLVLEDNSLSSNTNIFQESQWKSHKIYSESPSEFKQINVRGFRLDESVQYNDESGLNPSFQDMDHSYGSNSTILQSLFGSDNNTNQQEDSCYDQNQGMNYSYQSSYGDIMSGGSGSGGRDYPPPRPPQEFSGNSPPKVQPPIIPTQLHFSNNARFWIQSTQPLNDVRPSLFPLQMQSPSTIEDKPKNPISEMVKKSNTKSSSTKRTRNENPPLPAFKVRKEKMGDRITALQQLVSPFGKTDTASVLSEAIEYIKFLHEQVNVLSTPYMKNAAIMQQQQQISDKTSEGQGKDLRSRGLCLMPISSTFPVTHETTVDFWTPSFGGTFR